METAAVFSRWVKARILECEGRASGRLVDRDDAWQTLQLRPSTATLTSGLSAPSCPLASL